MTIPRSSLRNRRTFAAVATVAVLVIGPMLACTALISRDADQCSTDGDCDRFGTHPYCQDGVCVASGLGPVGCFFGDASTPDDFLNQCTASQCIGTNNCTSIGLCTDAQAALIPVPEAGPSTPASTSDAAPPPYCKDVAANVVYTAGSTALQPFLSVVAKLPPLSGTAYTIVYANTGSCTGVASQLDPDVTKHVVKGAAVYFDSTGTSHACLLDPMGTSIDVGVSDVFATSCSEPATAADVAEYLGPIQAMTFVVPQKSTQQTITAAEAHILFGTGGQSVPTPSATNFPWTDPTLYFVRNSGSGTQQMLARAIDVPANLWWGKDRGGSGAVKTGLEAVDPSLAEKAIGILSTDVVDPERGKLRYLAFQADGQDCAFYPDSSLTAKDKLSIRDGHYPVWGPVHLFTRVTNSIPSDAAQSIVTRFGLAAIDPQLLATITDVGLVPQCAMKVARTSELGPIFTQAPDYQCGCYFDSRVTGSTAPGCTACTTSADCNGVAGKPSCNYGYCESSGQ